MELDVDCFIYDHTTLMKIKVTVCDQMAKALLCIYSVYVCEISVRLNLKPVVTSCATARFLRLNCCAQF